MKRAIRARRTVVAAASIVALGAFGIGIMALSNIFVGGAMTLALAGGRAAGQEAGTG